MTPEQVQDWLDRYVAAWRTYDPGEIASLFAEDATYAYHPWDEPLRGRDSIVAEWLESQDAPGSWEAEYRPLMVEGDRAVVTGRTAYRSGDVFWNLWVLRFDDAGRCQDFVEWYMTEREG